MSIGLPSQGQVVDSSSSQTPPDLTLTGILVVDEDPAFQLGLKTFLREYVGFDKVYTAANGRDALDLIEADESIELVTLDYQMPGMNGIEVLQEIKTSLKRPLSVIMVTGYPSEELETEFHTFRSPTLLTNKFLSKPVEFEMLEPLMLAAIEELNQAKAKPESEESDEPGFFNDLPESNSENQHEQRLAQMEVAAANSEARISELEARLESQRKSGRARIWMGVLIIAVLWLASEFGLFRPLTPKWESFKSTIIQEITGKPPTPDTPAPETP